MDIKRIFITLIEFKEVLCLAVHKASEEKLRTALIRRLDKIKEPAEKLRVFLKSSFAILEEDLLMLAVFGRGEVNYA